MWGKASTLLRMVRTGQARYIAPQLYYRYRSTRAILSTKPMHSDTSNDTTVAEAHFLNSARKCSDLLYAAKSLLLHYPERLRLHIHFDGEPQQTVLQQVRHHLPDAKLTTRTERDQIVETWLTERGYEACLAARRLNVYAPKFMDVFLLTACDRVMLFDTDVLSFKTLARLADWHRTEQPTNLFGKDPVSHPYCLSIEEFQSRCGLKVKPHINTGSCGLLKKSMDFALMDRWLSTPDFPMTAQCVEQTITAALVTHADNVAWLPEDYNQGRTKTEEHCALIHYCNNDYTATRVAMRSIGHPLVLQQLKQISDS